MLAVLQDGVFARPARARPASAAMLVWSCRVAQARWFNSARDRLSGADASQDRSRNTQALPLAVVPRGAHNASRSRTRVAYGLLRPQVSRSESLARAVATGPMEVREARGSSPQTSGDTSRENERTAACADLRGEAPRGSTWGRDLVLRRLGGARIGSVLGLGDSGSSSFYGAAWRNAPTRWDLKTQDLKNTEGPEKHGQEEKHSTPRRQG